RAGTLWPGARWAFAGVALLALLLALGPTLNLDSYGQGSTGIPLPYSWLYDVVPGFNALRVPGRFGQLLMLGLAVLAGYGTARLSPPSPLRLRSGQAYPRATGERVPPSPFRLPFGERDARGASRAGAWPLPVPP